MFPALSMMELRLHFIHGDVQRLEEFVNHQCEAPFITDILPAIARLYFLRKMRDFKLKPVKAVSYLESLRKFTMQLDFHVARRVKFKCNRTQELLSCELYFKLIDTFSPF